MATLGSVDYNLLGEQNMGNTALQNVDTAMTFADMIDAREQKKKEAALAERDRLENEQIKAMVPNHIGPDGQIDFQGLSQSIYKINPMKAKQLLDEQQQAQAAMISGQRMGEAQGIFNAQQPTLPIEDQNKYYGAYDKGLAAMSAPEKVSSGMSGMVQRKYDMIKQAYPDMPEEDVVAFALAPGQFLGFTPKYIQKAAEKAATVTGASKNVAITLDNEGKTRQAIQTALQGASSPAGQQERKVNQAIHARSLIDASKQPDGTYKINKAMHGELISTIASLLGAGAQATDSQREELIQRSLSGDALEKWQYFRSQPEGTIPQPIIKMLTHMIDRQGEVSEDLRDKYIENIKKNSGVMTPAAKKRIEDIKAGSSFKEYLKGSESDDGWQIIDGVKIRMKK